VDNTLDKVLQLVCSFFDLVALLMLRAFLRILRLSKGTKLAFLAFRTQGKAHTMAQPCRKVASLSFLF